jgi:5'-3' exoribonuclease 1
MGIPFYFGEIIAKSPQSKFIVVDKCPQHCARLYLDFNSIIHPCSAKVISQLSQQERVGQQLYKQIFNNIAEYTMKLVEIAKPRDLLYIAVDGVAPRAKMHQQRKRRYLSAQRNTCIQTFKGKHNIPHTAWDSNCITPGTHFMEQLNNFLKNDFTDMIKNTFNNGLQVIVSGSDEEGEGEHKMVHYIKRNPLATPQAIDVIYGLDADLIMLSLTSQNANIVLMREAMDFGHLGNKQRVPFKFLMIKNLRQSICDTITDVHEQSIINDYVFICILLG